MYVPAATPRIPSTRNIAWIVIASILAAVLLSAVLVLVVAAGARENMITAAVLFAFAAGTALLAVLSTRNSDQPQRWAWVAAGWLSIGGIVLVTWPGVVATEAIAWMAPVLLLAFVVWMTLRVRRELHSRVRPLVVYPVLAVTAVAAIAAGLETAQEWLDRRSSRMSGQLVALGDGRRLHLRCTGSGSPTVVLLPGFGETSASWGWIAPDVARDTRVCVYDRAGRGWSDPAPGQQDGIAIATDLHALLTSANEAPPYVLAGHSLGGLYVRVFAARYPAQTAGVVLLDATDPRQFTLPAYPPFYDRHRRISALFPSLARFGVGRLAYQHSFDNLPPEAAAEERLFWFTARMARSQRDEFAAAPQAMAQADSLVTLGDRPLMVVTAIEGSMEGWTALQADLPKLSTNSGRWSLATTTHADLVASKADAAFASQAIREVVAAVRTSKPLTRH
jgi:pimeloyl-ACP methyl ester carboxylesterase